MKLRCVVERITFQSPETGYTVLKCAVKGYPELVPVVGNLLDANVGSVLLIEGSWKVDSKYGQQFLAESWEETLPASVYGIEKYLGSGLIKGVGPKVAKWIVNKFQENTLEIIETDPDRLIEVDGIGKKRVEKIKESWERQKEVKNIMIFLQGNGVSTAYAAKIYKQYGKDSIDVVKANPYRLADDIWGIGFKTADQIASKMGIEKNSFIRCRSGLLYTLSQLADQGHVYSLRDQLLKTGEKLLEVDEAVLADALEQMITAGDLKLDDEAIYLPPFYFAEIGVASKLKAINASKPEEVKVTKLQTGIEYDEIQLKAIETAVNSKVMVLTGGPGTGKTTTTLGIINELEGLGLKVLLAAPTGRAAKRMSEATGKEAKTIHRLLEFKPPEGYQRNDQNPLEGDVLIVDEASMIDLVLMNSLLKAIPISMRLILVGDIDQLPSVGAGNVLRDIISSESFPVIQLTHIFRQAQGSKIVMNAHAINRGEFPDIRNEKETDFFWMAEEEPEKITEKIVDLVKNRLPKYCNVKPSAVQVLTPMQRGVIGATNLNQLIQQAINPEGPSMTRSGFIFRLYDKVMQIRNNYDKEVFNGDIGRIVDVDLEERELTVSFDGNAKKYDVTELDELVPAYATTIHKAQGSEYPVVVMPVSMSHYMMLQRNLIYTGITRAKKMLVLIGTKKALSYAIRNTTVEKRNSKLSERLKGQ